MTRTHALAAAALMLLTLPPTASALHEEPPQLPCEWDGEEPADAVLDLALRAHCTVVPIVLQVVNDVVWEVLHLVGPVYKAAGEVCYSMLGPRCVI